MRKVMLAGVAALVLAGCQTTNTVEGGPAKLDVSFTGNGWDGETVPDGQHCSKYGGDGETPPMRVRQLPGRTDLIVVAFNDRDYQRLSHDGGHGKIGFPVEQEADSVELPAVPGGRAELPGDPYVVAKNRATGDYAQPGYLPPCSGGRGNDYFAVVKAFDTDSDPNLLLAKATVELGSY